MKAQPDPKTPFIYPSCFSTTASLSRTNCGGIAVSVRIPLPRLCKEKRPQLEKTKSSKINQNRTKEKAKQYFLNP